MHILMQKRNVG